MKTEQRRPPEKLRVTRLQEAQLKELRAIEARCAEMYHAIGLSEEQVPVRAESDIARLTRHHDVLVAEADDRVAGYLAWADEAPGVAHLSVLVVSPDYHRFGIATRLVRELGDKATKHGIEIAATPVWERASWAMSFLGVRGFAPIDGALPDKLVEWREAREAELVQPGQRIWWAKTDGLGTIPGLPRPKP
jgi:amino-acid N-acetyltransferase